MWDLSGIASLLIRVLWTLNVTYLNRRMRPMTHNALTIRSLAGALILCAGFASPLALADEGAKDSKQETTGDPALSTGTEGSENTQRVADGDDGDADYVEVRVSLPDGRSFTRLEPKRNLSARYSTRVSAPTGSSISRSGGSSVSVGSRSVSGGSNSSSIKSGGSGGGGGGGSSMSFGGGGGGGGAAESTESPAEAKGDLSSAGVFSYGNSSSETGVSASQSNASSNSSNQRVSSLGAPSYDREGNATGGQRVEFHDAGMSAAVVGNRVYFTGVELVLADQPFEIITGTRVGTDAVITEDGRLNSNGSDPLSSFNTRESSIKIELEPGTIVELMMYTPSGNASAPEREQRTWTVRIR